MKKDAKKLINKVTLKVRRYYFSPESFVLENADFQYIERYRGRYYLTDVFGNMFQKKDLLRDNPESEEKITDIFISF